LLQRRTAVPEIVHEMCLASPAGADGHDGAVADRLAAAVRKLAGRSGRGRADAVDVLAAGEVLTPLARRCAADLERFLTEIALGAEADALDPRADAITLLTLHAAKGLEFSAVFLAGCERGLLPLWLPGADPDPAEERRLLFVGMTRARTHLFLTSAAKRRRLGAAIETGPSPFLAAISPTLLTRTSPARSRRPADRQLRLL
jgi:superfamily I DNA/RNA helicase